nr:MAG TPA: hypothetical protein [Crassvirales sp.]
MGVYYIKCIDYFQGNNLVQVVCICSTPDFITGGNIWTYLKSKKI